MRTIRKRIKIVVDNPIPFVYPEFQPVIGKVYDAIYVEFDAGWPFCEILVNGNRTIIRKEEFREVKK